MHPPMHPDADRSQAAGNPRTRHSTGQLALIGSALAVLAIAGILLGTALLAPEKDELPSSDLSGSRSVGESLAASGQGGVNRVDSLDTISAELAALRLELEEERVARQALAKRLASLSARVGTEDSESSVTGRKASGGRADDAASAAPTAAPTAATSSPAHGALAGSQEDRPWFDRDALGKAGISSSEIKEIEELWEQHEMDKLYLDDQSRRDGSFRTPDYNREVAALDRELRDDLGTEGYDAYLYATGQPNRVVVRQVLENSPAGRAGLQAGDEIISYSGNPVFRPRELKHATGVGELGTPRILEVLRDGRSIRFNVPSGPLGINLWPISAQPLLNR
ncbi:MAG: PDZ domain-containing protein [Deltaproteobacteria bacterium]|nr:PDZ domain-containing protein [Deltaproteobacteria bacterium]